MFGRPSPSTRQRPIVSFLSTPHYPTTQSQGRSYGRGVFFFATPPVPNQSGTRTWVRARQSRQGRPKRTDRKWGCPAAHCPLFKRRLQSLVPMVPKASVVPVAPVAATHFLYCTDDIR